MNDITAVEVTTGDAGKYTVSAPSLHYLAASNYSQTTNFTYITWDRLLSVARKPLCLAKSAAPCFCPHAAKGKRRADILDHNQFGMLIADIDHGQLELDHVVEILHALDLQQFLIYSTASHRLPGKGPRWRVCVPLVSTVDVHRWSGLTTYLNRVLSADDCTARVTQVAFAPNQISGAYEYVEGSGSFLDGNDLSHRMVSAAHHYAQEAHKRAVEACHAIPAPKRAVESLTGALSPIDAINASYEIQALMRQYGYRQIGGKWIHPHTTSGKPGVILVEGKYISYHGCDPLADGKTHDCFDLVCQWEHGGDLGSAIKAAAQIELPTGITIEKHNRIAYLKSQ